jgi:hypothetical protein
MGASNTMYHAILMIKVQYLDNTCLIGLIVEIHLVLMFHRILPLISMIFISLVNSKCFFGAIIKITIQTLQQIFNVENQR